MTSPSKLPAMHTDPPKVHRKVVLCQCLPQSSAGADADDAMVERYMLVVIAMGSFRSAKPNRMTRDWVLGSLVLENPPCVGARE